jgi:hypothetical protein
MLRRDFRRLHRDARLRLADLLVNGPEEGLARAEELYSALFAEDPEEERLWIALFRIHARTGSSHGLESACDTIQRDNRAWAYPGRRDRSRAVATESGACGSRGSTPPRRHSVGRCACPAIAEAKAPHSLGAARSVPRLGV